MRKENFEWMTWVEIGLRPQAGNNKKEPWIIQLQITIDFVILNPIRFVTTTGNLRSGSKTTELVDTIY